MARKTSFTVKYGPKLAWKVPGFETMAKAINWAEKKADGRYEVWKHDEPSPRMTRDRTGR